MVFSIILLVVAVALIAFAILANITCTGDDGTITGSIGALLLFVMLMVFPIYALRAKTNKALMQAHLENPTNYTYSQLAEHNELVTKLGVWHGTIFSFYNDVDLQAIDIDNVSQKVVVTKEEK